MLVTTSRLLSTGVDAQTCRLIVLDREVGSMTEFKQIVGRGTRVHEDTRKFYSTLIDFRGATSHFADPNFEGLPLDPIAEELGNDLDRFDLICHIAFDKKPLTRRERAENVKKRDVFTKYGGQARAVLDALLAKYADEGVLNLDDTNVLRIPPLSSLGTPVQFIKAFGGKEEFVAAVHEVQAALYEGIA